MTANSQSTDRDRPTSQGAGGEPVDIATAARLLGISPEAVRLRIRRGTLAAERWGKSWVVWPGHSLHVVGHGHDQPTDLAHDRPTNRPPPSRPQRRGRADEFAEATTNARDREISSLEETVCLLTTELDARRREVAELHVLLQRAQGPAVLPVGRTDQPLQRPTNRPIGPRPPWWRRFLQALAESL